MTRSVADPHSACGRYQDALLDFVDRVEAGPVVEAALAHLERCATCERDLAATALVLTALRRMFEDARAAETPLDAWPRLRDRVTADRPSVGRPRRWTPGTISGLVTGAALVTALLLPSAAHLGSSQFVSDLESPAVTAAASASSLAASHRYGASRTVDPFPNGREQTFEIPRVHQAEGIASGRYYDGIRPAPVVRTAAAPTPSRVLRPA